MMAMYKSDNGTSYTEITGRMPSSGYVINEEKSYCTSFLILNNERSIILEIYHLY